MMRRMAVCFLVFVLPFTLFAGTVGKISGIVTDKEDGKPLMGVNIVIKGTTIGAASGVDGRYFIFNVPPGIYDLEASYIGYAKTTIKNVRITVDITTDVNLELGKETIRGEEVVVIAQRPLIEVKATNERRVVRSEDIENIPVRGATDIAALQTGVVKVGNTLHVRGGRTEEVVYYIDGVYQVNDYNRIARPEAGEVSGNALEEISYQAGGFDAEYGSATAGIVSMSTKIGTGKFKISGEIITDEFLSKEKEVLGTYSYGYNIYNFSVGGPITNKIRFYSNIERKFFLDRRTSVGSHPYGEWLGDLNEDGIANYEEYEWEAKYGPLPNNKSGKWLGTGNLIFDFHPVKVKVGGNFARESYRAYIHSYAPFNSENNPLDKAKTLSLYSRATWTINPKTLLNVQGTYFLDGYEDGNHMYWDDFLKYGMRELPIDKYEEIYGGTIADTSVYDYYEKNGVYWLVVQPQLSQNGFNPRVKREYAQFAAPGTIYDDFSKNETSYKGFNADLKTQAGSHELKVGFDYRDYTIRYYRLGAPMRLASSYINNPPYTDEEYTALKNDGSPLVAKYADYDSYVDQYWFLNYKNAYAENMGYTIDGKDYINESLDDNRDGPRTPKVGGIYFQDKIELKDLIVNLGVRYDYIAPDNFKFRDEALIIIDTLGQIAENVYLDEKGAYSSYEATSSDAIGRTQMVKADPHHIISPRLGLAFPVTDRTVFHAQYGKYVQQPQLNRMFLSYLRFAANLQQGNFTISGNPALEPVKTTSYEIGFKQQTGQNSSVDITMFYKQMTGYVQVRNVTGAKPVVYATYVNGDYGSVKGLSFSYNLRRTGHIQALVNYTLQYAGGTGSTATGQYRIAWQSGNYPTFVSPLDFDQRHTGTINIDFRTTEKDIIGPAGVNFLFTFGSGRRYTPTRINSAVFPAISSTPIAALNSGTMPFIYELNMKIDKSIKFKGSNITFYLWVENLLNTRNVRNVYDGTGLPDYDGWFNTPEGKAWKQNPANSVEFYNMRQGHPYNFETPRTIRLGVKFDIG